MLDNTSAPLYGAVKNPINISLNQVKSYPKPNMFAFYLHANSCKHV